MSAASVAFPSTRSVLSGANAGGKAAMIASCTGVGTHTTAATCSVVNLVARATLLADTAASFLVGLGARWQYAGIVRYVGGIQKSLRVII